MTTQLQTRTQSAVTLRQLVELPAYKNRFDELLKDRSSQFVASMVQLVNATPQLQNCDPHSIIAGCITAAALDLPIEKSLGFAWIVPYGNQAQFQIGYRGYVQLAIRTGQYKFINVTEVYEGEMDSHNPLTSEITLNRKNKKSDTIIGYAAYFKLVSGYEHAEFWDVQTVKDHASRFSQAFRSKREGPWLSDFDAMACKTVLKSLLSHWGPMSVEMRQAVNEDQAVRATITSEPNFPDNVPAVQDPKKPDFGGAPMLPAQPSAAGVTAGLPAPTASSAGPTTPVRRGRPPKTATLAETQPVQPPQGIAQPYAPVPPVPQDQPEPVQEAPPVPADEPQGEEDPFAPPPEPPIEPEAQPEPAAAAPEPSKSAEIDAIRQKMFANQIPEDQLMRWLTARKVAKGEQKLEDFVTNGRSEQLVKLLKGFDSLVPGIKQQA